MRLRKSFKIEGYEKEITVKEMTCEEVLNLLSEYAPSADNEETSDKATSSGQFDTIFGIIGGFGKAIEYGLEGITVEDMKKMAPSELAIIYDHFKEVNKYFFEVAQTLELGKMLKELVKGVLEVLSTYAANLSRQAMEEELGSMDSPS